MLHRSAQWVEALRHLPLLLIRRFIKKQKLWPCGPTCCCSKVRMSSASLSSRFSWEWISHRGGSSGYFSTYVNFIVASTAVGRRANTSLCERSLLLSGHSLDNCLPWQKEWRQAHFRHCLQDPMWPWSWSWWDHLKELDTCVRQTYSQRRNISTIQR